MMEGPIHLGLREIHQNIDRVLWWNLMCIVPMDSQLKLGQVAGNYQEWPQMYTEPIHPKHHRVEGSLERYYLKRWVGQTL